MLYLLHGLIGVGRDQNVRKCLPTPSCRALHACSCDRTAAIERVTVKADAEHRGVHKDC